MSRRYTASDRDLIQKARNIMEQHKKKLEEKNNNQTDKKDDKNTLIENPINTSFSKQNIKIDFKNKGFYWRDRPFNPGEQKVKPQIEEIQQNQVSSMTAIQGDISKNNFNTFSNNRFISRPNNIDLSNNPSPYSKDGKVLSREEMLVVFNKRRKAFFAKIDEEALIKEQKKKEIEKKKQEEELKKEKKEAKRKLEFFRKVFKNNNNIILRHFFMFFSNNLKLPFKSKKICFFIKKRKYIVKYKNFLKKKGKFLQNKNTIKIYLYLIKNLYMYLKLETKSLYYILKKLRAKNIKSSLYVNINSVLLKYIITFFLKLKKKGINIQGFNFFEKQGKDIKKGYREGDVVNIFEHMLCRAQLKYNYILKRGCIFDPETAFFSKNKLSFPHGLSTRDKKVLIRKWEENNPFEDFFAIPKYNFYYKNHLPFKRNKLLKFKKEISLEMKEALKEQFPFSEHIFKIFEYVPSSTESKPLYRCTLHFIKNRMFFNRNHFLKSYVRYNVPNVHYEFFIQIFERLYRVKSKAFIFSKKKKFEMNKKPVWENKFKKRLKNKKRYMTKEFFMPFLSEKIKEKTLSYLHQKLKQPVNLFFFNFSSLIPNETVIAKCQYLNKVFRKSLSFQTKSEDFITMWLIALFNKNANLLTKLVINEIQKIRKPQFFFAFLKQFFILLKQELKNIGIIGIKIRISGRFSKRTRAITSNIKFGKLPLQTLETSFDYYYGQAVTHYGATGVKVWIAFKSSKKTLRQQNILKSLKYNLKYNLKDQIKKTIKIQ
jgi:hypothetical protein